MKTSASEFCVIWVTVPDAVTAERIAGSLVTEHLAACVNQIPGVRSIYYWQGKLENTAEWLLLIKTRYRLMDRLLARVKTLHPYTVPEIIALPILAGSADYIHWLEEMTQPSTSEL